MMKRFQFTVIAAALVPLLIGSPGRMGQTKMPLTGVGATAAAGGGPTLGVHSAVAHEENAAASITTAGINTQTSGSSFWVCAQTTGTWAATPITDNKSNTYTLAPNTSGTIMRAYVINGTGGTGHTFTATTTATSFIDAIAVEIKNATAFDKGTAQATSTSPFRSPSVTTTAANEILLGCGNDNSIGAGDTFTAGNSFTLLDQFTDGSCCITMADAYRMVTSTASYYFEIASVDNNPPYDVSIDTIK